MDINAIAFVANQIKAKFELLKREQDYKQIAQLITYSLQTIPKEYNLQIFGYLPSIFREVEVFLDDNSIQKHDIFIGEPVVYKIYYPNKIKVYNLSYFYVFCYLKEDCQDLNVYFQSANPDYKQNIPEDYNLVRQTIGFEGCVSEFQNDRSFLSISDPGQFIPGYASSFYVGSVELNLTKLIAEIVEQIIILANLKTQDTLLIGSSAGTFGALLSSSYFTQKVNVLAVNSQVHIQYRKDIIKLFDSINKPEQLIRQYGEQVSCFHRFRQELNSVPNIYILANVNDNLYHRNFKFYQLYINRYTQKGINNQSVFDSYYGVEGHGRPEVSSLKAKIRIAREVLTMKSN